MAYLSVPSPGKWISDILGKRFFDHFFEFWIPTIFEKMDLRWLLWPKCQVKKVSYIDILVMRFSPKSELLIGNFHYLFMFLVKPCYFVFTRQKISSKENSDVRTSF